MLQDIINTQKLKARDYDIVSNDYVNYNKEKRVIEKEMDKLHAAKNYWKSFDFDLVKCQYIDENKENKYIEDRKEKAKVWGKDHNKHRHPE